MRSGEMKADGKILWDGGNTHSEYIINFGDGYTNPRWSVAKDVEPGDRVVATETYEGIWEVKPETPKTPAPKPRHKRRSPKK